jgi:hypothetical protein
MKNHYANLTISTSLVLALTGCGFINSNTAQTSQCPDWKVIRKELKSKNYSRAFSLADIGELSCTAEESELDSILESYKLTSNVNLKRLIIRKLPYLTDEASNDSSSSIKNFLQVVLKEDKPFLAAAAVNRLASLVDYKQLLEVYQLRQEEEIREAIIQELNLKTQKWAEDSEVISLYKTIVRSENMRLSPVALRGIIALETNVEGSRSTKWENWEWSSPLSQLFQEAVNGKFYLLNSLDQFEVMAIVKRYPDSAFVKGFKEYRLSIGSNTVYFSPDSYSNLTSDGNNTQEKEVFNQPFVPSKERIMWDTFLKRYPEHPSTDNVHYRVARGYEMEEDYEKAILTYHQAFKSGDGDMSSFAGRRILFLMDFASNSQSLDKFITNHPQHPLIPYAQYIQAIHLLREGKLEEAQQGITRFLTTYQEQKMDSLYIAPGQNSSSPDSYLGLRFWENVRKQKKDIEDLEIISKIQPSDERLYKEATFYFDYYLVQYNNLWIGGMQVGGFLNFMPNEWNPSSSLQFSMSSELIKRINLGWKQQLGWLTSARRLEKLLEEYPNSKLKEKATYMIAVCYYRIATETDSPPLVLDELSNSWSEQAIVKFRDFLGKYPKSSMADDALLSIAYVLLKQPAEIQETGNTEADQAAREQEENRLRSEARKVAQELLSQYPGGDRVKEARKLIESREQGN